MPIEDNQTFKSAIQILENMDITNYTVIVSYEDVDGNSYLIVNKDQSLVSQSNIFINTVLQFQYKYNINLEDIVETVASQNFNFRDRLLSPITSDIDYQVLFKEFNHTKSKYDEKYYQDMQQSTNKTVKILKELLNSGAINQYMLFINYDDDAMTLFAPKDSDEAINILTIDFMHFIDEHNIDADKYLRELIKTSKMLRTQLIHVTIDRSNEKKNSVLLKLAKKGMLDFERDINEHELEHQITEKCIGTQNQDQDQHIVFVETRFTNYLSLTYSDFDKFKGYLLLLTQAVFQQFPKDYDAKFMNSLLQREDIDTIFYPSKIWRRFNNSSSYRDRKTDSDFIGIQIQEMLTSNVIDKPNGIYAVIAGEFSNGIGRFVISRSTLYLDDITIALTDLLGTLMSVYPEHKDKLQNWAVTANKYINSDYIDY